MILLSLWPYDFRPFREYFRFVLGFRKANPRKRGGVLYFEGALAHQNFFGVV